MASYQSPLSAIVKGALAGAAGTWVMGKAMANGPQLLERAGVSLPKPPPGPSAPDSPTEEMAERLAEGVAEVGIDEEMKAAGGQVVHWAYGAAWGAFFGVMQATIKLPHLVHGTLLGLLVGTVADTVMPQLRLQNPPSRRPAILNATYMGYHLVYGWTVASVWALLNLGRRG